MTSYAEAVTEPAIETPKANPYLQVLIGLLVFFAASFAALLSAAELGVAGVFIAALIEAIAIAGLYRWCAA